MGQHAYHGRSEKSELEADGSSLDSKMLKVVGNGVDHTYFVIEADDEVMVCEAFNIFDIGLRNTHGHLPILSDHGIGAQPPVSSKIEHVGRLRQQEDTQVNFFHQLAASF